MVTELKLFGGELLIYSAIYGFTQEQNQWYTGARQYLADWTGCTKQTVTKYLKSLVEKGFFERTYDSARQIRAEQAGSCGQNARVLLIASGVDGLKLPG